MEQCLPADRDWSKREKCNDCLTKGLKCGPNVPYKTAAPQMPSSISNVPTATTTSSIDSSSSLFPPPPSNAQVSTFGSPSGLTNAFSCWAGSQSVSTRGGFIETTSGGARQEKGLLLQTIEAEYDPSLTLLLDGSLMNSFRLVELGEYVNLFEGLQNPLHAAAIVSQVPYQSPQGDVHLSLNCMVQSTSSHISRAAWNIFKKLVNLDGHEQKYNLCRLLGKIDWFTKARSAFQFDDDTGDNHGNLKHLESSILRSLIKSYDHTDRPEADHLRRRLAVISSPDSAEEVAAFRRMSETIPTIFHNLELASFNRNILSDKCSISFPAAHLAVMSQRRAAAQIMYQDPAYPVGQTDILKRNALHLAAQTSDIEMANTVIAKDPALLHSRDIYSLTPLCIAAYVGDPQFFHTLVRHGARLDDRDDSGRTIMCIASGAGHYEIVKYLLDSGQDPNDDILEKMSALNAAAAGGHEKIARLLLDRGAKASWRSRGRLASQEAWDNQHIPLYHLLLQAEQKETPLDLRSQMMSSMPRTSPWIDTDFGGGSQL